MTPPDLQFGPFILSVRGRRLTREGAEVSLTPKAFDTLAYLVDHAGEVVEKKELMKAVWQDVFVDDSTVTQNIFTLRKALGDGSYIETIPRRGYRFTLTASSADIRKVDIRKRAGFPKPAASFAIVALLGIAAVFLPRSKPPLTSGSLKFWQITNFTDSARAPALSPDGRMVAFIRGGAYFQSRGQIYVKLIPDGEAVQLTHETDLKYAPTFTPDGTRVAYTLLKPGGSWDTWTVPVQGGPPTRLLPNASGLSWIDNRRVLFSEIMAGTGAHMGIVTSTADRSGERTIYFPEHERAMAHYSYASPDRKWALIIEMDQTTAWQRCRLMPLDGSTSRQVGPNGACLAAGWSADGRWMYFNAEVEGAWHLWRQPFPDGNPEQVTSGPSEEEGIAIAPDGRSLITSVGRRYSTIWVHDSNGDRPISAEAFAFGPRLSADGERVFYLQRQSPVSLSSRSAAPSRSSPFGVNGTLHSLDLASGKVEPLFPDYAIGGGGVGGAYSISPDEKEVLFTTVSDGKAQIMLAPLDRHSPPVAVVRGGGAGLFGLRGEILFVAQEGEKNYLYRINRDGSGRGRVTDTPVIGFPHSISPDGEWAPLLAPAGGSDTNWQTVAFQIHGRNSKTICQFFCYASWSHDSRYLYLDLDISQNSQTGKTFVIPLSPGKSFPDLPKAGFAAPAEIARLPGVKVIDRSAISPGPDSSTYAFTKQGFEGNLFRIELPQ